MKDVALREYEYCLMSTTNYKSSFMLKMAATRILDVVICAHPKNKWTELTKIWWQQYSTALKRSSLSLSAVTHIYGTVYDISRPIHNNQTKPEEVNQEAIEVFLEYIWTLICPLVEIDFNPADIHKVCRHLPKQNVPERT